MIHIIRLFFHFDRYLGAVPIGNGNINDTYRIDFELAGTCKTALLQRINHLVFHQPENVMHNTLRVCQHLAGKTYPYKVLTPLPAINGSFLHKDEAGNYWRAFSFIENSFAPEGTSDPDIAYKAARAYGAFARGLRDFPVHTLFETIAGFHDTDRRWQVFMKILEEDPALRAAETSSEISTMMTALPVFDKISQFKRSGALPLRVAHNDTKAGNVLFDLTTRKALAVIDLDTVMPGTLLSDFGDMVRTLAPDCAEDGATLPTVRTDVVDAITRGFLEETDDFLTKVERENLMLGAAWMAGEQALRFLTDWLAGDVYYKITSPKHNLLRAQNQLVLFQTMNDKR